jgi:serine protease Do
MSRLRQLPCLSLALLFPLALFASTRDVKIDTIPPGAQVELNGSLVCTTPCSLKISSAYFGTKHTAFSGHSEVPLSLRITKEGFVPKNFDLTTGPIHWKNLYGDNLFDYYVVTSTQYTIHLDTVQDFVGRGQPAEAVVVRTETVAAIPNSMESVVQNAIPAVVRISGSKGSGSGFFVTPDGLIVTNAHVVQGESSVTVTTSSGKSLQSSSVYVDDDRDLAFVKIAATDCPVLRLRTFPPNVGSDVIAIGSPLSEVLTNTVTKGVVSGIRQLAHGTWIQTDTALNHGNSGGPLLNNSGEVVGVNTIKIVAPDVTGINFSLASSEVASLLNSRLGISINKQGQNAVAVATVAINSNPSGADIEVDGVFVGSTPAEIPLGVGERTVKISKKGFSPFERKLEVVAGGKQTVAAELETTKP